MRGQGNNTVPDDTYRQPYDNMGGYTLSSVSQDIRISFAIFSKSSQEAYVAVRGDKLIKCGERELGSIARRLRAGETAAREDSAALLP